MTYKRVEADGFRRGPARSAHSTTDVELRGSTSVDDIPRAPEGRDLSSFAIGGAEHAGELDAKRAIDQGVRLASKIETAAPDPAECRSWQAGALEGSTASRCAQPVVLPSYHHNIKGPTVVVGRRRRRRSSDDESSESYESTATTPKV